MNGCPNSCARIQTADIGLKGQLIPGPSGEQVEGFQVHLGGGLASIDRDDPGLGRKVRGLKVTADDLPDYVERVVRAYVAAHWFGIGSTQSLLETFDAHTDKSLLPIYSRWFPSLY